MPAETGFVFKYPGVVNDQRIVDTVFRIVYVFWLIGIDNLDEVAVGDDGTLCLVNGDMPIKGSVYGVTAQKACTFAQVSIATTPNHYRPES